MITEGTLSCDEEETSTFERAVKSLALYGLEEKPSAPNHTTLKRASVLVLLSNDGKVQLNQRSLQLRSHPGQVCFPGGKQDPSDKGDDILTAIRETEEEVGLQLRQDDPLFQLLCRMPTVMSINYLCVTPVVAFLNKSAAEIHAGLKLNESEVQKSFWVPLEFFVKTKPILEENVPWDGDFFLYREYECVEIETGAKLPPITGLTAHMAREVAKVAFCEVETRPCCSSSEFCGHLYRYFNEDTGRPYWSRKYFVLGNGSLHQYDSERQASQKSQSANKKNRLRLVSGHVQIIQNEEGEAHNARFLFKIECLEGRVVWKLAASSDDERDEWVKCLSAFHSNPLSLGTGR